MQADAIGVNAVELVVVEMDVVEVEEREADAVDFWEPALPLKRSKTVRMAKDTGV